ncbi:peptidase [Priestia taiwanensis]|uniref:Acetylornithine deacetylase n=1 Tax=Priestia taiwanensis TaxID=1347902 RepID=A0A917AL02_9BACI|nr:peptidase [Priestia taiwanensis]MBM7362150.1 acetylornithine deacetylase [Priestia taiwanensis]GGE59828.1 acetylornithine deacetylase [Priestia taiwanensis]
MREYKERVLYHLKRNQQEGIKLLKQLIREKSIQEYENKSQAIVAEKLRLLGLKVDIWEPNIKELEKHAYFLSARKNFDGSPNVVGTLKGVGGGKSLILNGHIDVVPEGDEAQWEFDPYSAKIVNKRLYGRGTSDMKGGNVCMLMALEAIIDSGIQLKGDVYFQSVIEEESGGAGTLATILRGYTADAVLIPEPTSMKIFPKQQGSVWFRMTIHGKSAHGGTRYEGVNAIELSMRVVAHIQELEKVRNSRITDPLYKGIPIPIPINIGKINGGTWPSSVADVVTLEGRMGVAPDESMEAAREEFEQWMEQLKIDTVFQEYPLTLEWFGARWHPGTIDVNHEFMQALTNNYRYCLKELPKIEASPWGTDGGLFTHVANIPTIVFGPGETKVAHHPNEYIDITRLHEASEIIACTILDWCGVHDES